MYMPSFEIKTPLQNYRAIVERGMDEADDRVERHVVEDAAVDEPPVAGLAVAGVSRQIARRQRLPALPLAGGAQLGPEVVEADGGKRAGE